MDKCVCSSYNILLGIQMRVLVTVYYSIHKVNGIINRSTEKYRTTKENWPTKSRKMLFNYITMVGDTKRVWNVCDLYMAHNSLHFKMSCPWSYSCVIFCTTRDLYEQLTLIMHDTGPISHAWITLPHTNNFWFLFSKEGSLRTLKVSSFPVQKNPQ